MNFKALILFLIYTTFLTFDISVSKIFTEFHLQDSLEFGQIHQIRYNTRVLHCLDICGDKCNAVTYDTILRTCVIYSDAVTSGEAYANNRFSVYKKVSSNPISKMYIFVHLNKNWTDAQAFCQEMYSGDLASVRSEQELYAIRDSMLMMGESDTPWIGGRRIDNTWRWANDDPMAWAKWAPGKPTVSDGNCTFQYLSTSTAYENLYLTWNQSDCAMTNRFVCETYRHV